MAQQLPRITIHDILQMDYTDVEIQACREYDNVW